MEGEQSRTLLGDWYATALAWRPQVALLVNATTLLPVLMPLAPVATMTARLADQIGIALAAYGTPDVTVQAEYRTLAWPWAMARLAEYRRPGQEHKKHIEEGECRGALTSAVRVRLWRYAERDR
jgi:hypothetical protein